MRAMHLRAAPLVSSIHVTVAFCTHRASRRVLECIASVAHLLLRCLGCRLRFRHGVDAVRAARDFGAAPAARLRADRAALPTNKTTCCTAVPRFMCRSLLRADRSAPCDVAARSRAAPANGRGCTVRVFRESHGGDRGCVAAAEWSLPPHGCLHARVLAAQGCSCPTVRSATTGHSAVGARAPA